MLETERRGKEKSWLCTAKRLFRSGAPDCPVMHRTVSGAPGCLDLKTPLSGICRRRTAKIHRTVRCAPDCPVSQRSAGPTVGRANGRPRDLRGTRGRANGREGAPDCPVCTGHVRCANGSRICNGRFRHLRKGIGHRTLSGAPDDRRQRWPSRFVLNGS